MKQNAKTVIIDCFKKLLIKHSLDKITVKEICDDCAVSRHTFYYYFTDIMDILKYVIFQELSLEIAHNKTFETWEEGFLSTMNYFKRNSKMILHIYHSSYWTEANIHFTSLSNNLVGGVVEECIDKMNVKLQEKDKTFIIDF